MSSKKLDARLAVFALVCATGAAIANGCSSSDNNNPAPSTNDGGHDATSSSSSGGSGSSSGGSGSSSGGGNEGGVDVPVIDTGMCTSDASTCNSCYTPTQAAEDPLNACAPETANCIAFTRTVPTHPTL
jgi:hypothetical protein